MFAGKLVEMFNSLSPLQSFTMSRGPASAAFLKSSATKIRKLSERSCLSREADNFRQPCHTRRVNTLFSNIREYPLLYYTIDNKTL